MRSAVRKPAAKGDAFLVSMARSIGSTLGAVAAKVNPSPRKPRRRSPGRKAANKQSSTIQKGRRISGATSTHKGNASIKPRNGKKSAK
jgi:hypothetical protein